ncbi:MAG: hypothetical protein IH969_02255 [Candidatus Krumholzibacteriota bacterium]|nr:hypothetical protein [Candidatus Krumholzibacteriota bacterium]
MKPVVRFALLLLLLFAAVVPEDSFAQDTNYWNNQYGPRSMLLGGAVIGSVTDMSATFYNPGALGYIENPELLLSANAYQIETLKVTDGAGEGIDLTSTQFNLLPNMLAGAFRKSWLGKNKIAYSFLTRHRFDAEVKGATTDRIDILPDPGDEEFAGALSRQEDARELWTGITWARGLSSKVGVGVTTYLSIRNESSTSVKFAQALTDSGDISLLFDLENFSSTVYSLLWKAGVGINLNPLTIGVTLTTSNVRLFGSGEATLNNSVVRVDIDGDGNPDNAFETDFQEDVHANYESPWSVGFGAGYFFEHTQLHFSAEWFDAVELYDVLELDSFTSQTTGETLERSVQQKRESVVNFAAGIQRDFGEKYGGFLSFNTDNTAFSPESDISVTGIDISHITAGTTVSLGRTNWMLGLSYAFGSEETTQAINLNPGDDGSLTTGNPVDLEYRRSTLMVGFRVDL